MAGLYPPEFETKVATVLDLQGCWKDHPDIVHLVAREAAEGGATVEQTDKLRRVQSRPKGAIARVGSAKEEKGEVIGQGGQGSRTRSGDSKSRGSCWNCGKESHRMADCTTKRKSGPPAEQQQATTQPGGANDLWAALLFPAKFQARSGPGIPYERKGCTAGRAFPYAHARRFLERWVSGGSGHQYHRGATGGRGARSSVAYPTK